MIKKIFFLTVILLSFHILYGQNQISSKKRLNLISAAPVVYLWDTIYSNAKHYCVMKELKLNEYHLDFIVQNLLGENCLYIRYDKAVVLGGHYNVRFNKSGKNVTIALKDETGLPDFIVGSDLFLGNEIPESREKNFLNNYSSDYSMNVNTNNSEDSAENKTENSESDTSSKRIVQFPTDSTLFN